MTTRDTAAPASSAATAGRTRPGLMRLLLRLLGAQWTHGRLTVRLPDGEVHVLEGREPGPAGVLHVHDGRFVRRVLASGDIGFAEGYMAGEWDSPHLAALLETLAGNYDHIRRLFDGGPMMRTIHGLVHRLRRNSRAGARRNIHAHYDLGNAFYGAWLDPSMTYSSARFARPGLSLEEAQREKYASLARIMDLRPGHRVLEIGCGWGGFMAFAAGEIGADVTGLTLSKEQHDYAQQRLFEAGLADHARVLLTDYRDMRGQFDRVASIEMFEAVGQAYWPDYFTAVRRALAPGGVAGLQLITIQDALFDNYSARTDFIQRHIFPGGMLPSEERLAPIVAEQGLAWGETQRFGKDYAETLSQWDRRFQAAWPEILRLGGFDERFRRLWRFYLAYCEAGFRSGRTDVIQVALSAP